MRIRALWARYRVEAWLVLAGLSILVGSGLAQTTILKESDPSWFVPQPQPTILFESVGVPLDDVYIHCRYAHNLLSGGGFGFQPNEPLSADTSPLWVLLLALSGLITTDLPAAAVALSALSYLMLGPGVFRVSRDLLHLEESWAALAGVLTVLASRLVWSATSGMEVTLAALLALLLAEEHARQVGRGAPRWREGMLIGLGFLARPELALLGGMCMVDWVLQSRRSQERVGWRYAEILAVAIVLAFPWVAFNLMTGDSLVSHSSTVQGARASLLPHAGYLGFVSRILAAMNILLMVGFLFSLRFLKDPRWRVGILFVILLPILQSVLAPQFRHHGRYFFPILPLLVMFGVAGVRSAIAGREKLALVVSALLIVLSGFDTARWIALSGYSVRNINDQHVQAAAWLDAHVPKSAAIAAHDVGMLGYLSNRKVIDLTGLVTPELYPVQSDQHVVWSKARAMGAEWFLIYNRLNPTLYQNFKDSLELLAEFRIRKPIVASADTVMSMYRVKQ